MKTRDKQKGFTLMELVVYLAILAVAVTVVAVFAVDIIGLNNQEKSNRATLQNARLVLERLKFETRWANSVSSPFQGDEVTLQTARGQIRFYLDAGANGQQAMFINSGGYSNQLTDDTVVVSDFSLETVDPGNAPPSMAVNLVIEDIEKSEIKTDIDTIITVRSN